MSNVMVMSGFIKEEEKKYGNLFDPISAPFIIFINLKSLFDINENKLTYDVSLGFFNQVLLVILVFIEDKQNEIFCVLLQ